MTNILCIEDVADLREDIAEELEDAGYKVLQAGDGQQGLELILEHKPALVISDITMPSMNGFELVAEIRNNHSELARMPFIFLSALADSQDVAQGLREGADDYLTKPIDFDLLLVKVEAILRQQQRIAEKTAIEQVKIVKALTQAGNKIPDDKEIKASKTADICLVGPKSPQLNAIETAIRGAGQEVAVLHSGRQFATNPAYQRCKLALLWLDCEDQRAPITRKMRANCRTRHVLVATRDQLFRLEKQLTKPFFDILEMPASKEEFEKRLDIWLRKIGGGTAQIKAALSA